MSLVENLLELLQAAKLDYTVFFRTLSNVDTQKYVAATAGLLLEKSAYEHVSAENRDQLIRWLRSYLARVEQEQADSSNRSTKMNSANPKYILRNYYAQLAIDGAEDRSYEYLEGLFNVLQRPFAEGTPEEEEKYAKLPPASSLSLKCSCSS